MKNIYIIEDLKELKAETEKKKINYNFDLMRQDFLKIITGWKES